MSEELNFDALSLSDLADFDTSELSALTSRLPAKGMFVVKAGLPTLTKRESEDPAKPPLWNLGFKYEILQVESCEPNVNPEDLVGRTITEGYTLWPDALQEGVQLVMGRYKQVDLPHHGRFGGNPEKEPGWFEGLEGHIFYLRVRHFTTKNGTERAGFDWKKFNQAEE